MVVPKNNRTGVSCGNRVIQDLQRAKENRLHRERIHGAQARVDCGRPSAMNVVFRSKNESAQKNAAARASTQDFHMVMAMAQIATRPYSISAPRSIASSSKTNRKSLNQDKRRRDLTQITIDNQKILKSLKNARSHYSCNNFLEDYEKHQQHVFTGSSQARVYLTTLQRKSRSTTAPTTQSSSPPDVFQAECQRPMTCHHSNVFSQFDSEQTNEAVSAGLHEKRGVLYFHI